MNRLIIVLAGTAATMAPSSTRARYVRVRLRAMSVAWMCCSRTGKAPAPPLRAMSVARMCCSRTGKAPTIPRPPPACSRHPPRARVQLRLRGSWSMLCHPSPPLSAEAPRSSHVFLPKCEPRLGIGDAVHRMSFEAVFSEWMKSALCVKP